MRVGLCILYLVVWEFSYVVRGRNDGRKDFSDDEEVFETRDLGSEF
jgi:hypothetical protein